MCAAFLLAGVPLAGDAFASPSPVERPWGAFSLTSASGSDTTEIAISSVLITNTSEARPETTWIDDKTERVWVAMKRVVKAGALTSLQWTDSRACYQLIETLSDLVDLDAPGDMPTVRVDDASTAKAAYRIEAAGLLLTSDGSAVRLRNGRTVRAGAIVQAALDAWGPCWSDRPSALTPRP
jgi:hypothetical protein